MKTLTLIRHAKSDWSNESLDDFDRGLAPRGEKQIKEMGKLLKKISPKYDYIICSSALRTVLTYEGLAKEYTDLKKVPTIFAHEIYDYAEGHMDKVLDFMKKVEDNIDSLVVVGHNTLFNELVEQFTGITGLHVGTLCIVEICFRIDSWENIKTGKIKMFLSPSK